MSQLLEIRLEDIRENPDALRAVARDSEQFREMVDSVKEVGILNPINVRELKGEDGSMGYVLVDGLHRYSAACEANLQTIPAQVVDLDESRVYEAQIIANSHKVDTRPIEYTKALLRILGANPTMTSSELSKRIGKSPSWLNERLRLLKLDSKIQTLVDENKISLMNGSALAKLPLEEQGNYVEQAMTTKAQEFVPMIEARAKEIRDAARQGRKAEPAEWAPVAHLRKLAELKDARESDTLSKLVAKHGITSAADGALFALAWALNLDPEGVERQRAKHEQRMREREEAKAKRAAEREAQKVAEAAEAATTA